MDWRPGASLDVLRARAALIDRVRAFFAARGVLEVDTPVLGRCTVTDPEIKSIGADGGWLQTSPEYFMKRLLAAGSGPIYQFAHAFRAEERGRRHNPEFLLLEWYRPGFDDGALMDEIEALLASVLPGPAPLRLPFAALVGGAFDVDPLTADNEALAAALTGHWAHIGREGDPLHLTDGRRTGLLDLLYAEASERIEGRAFVTDFPPEMSALARLREDDAGRRVAARFELVVDGVELANGFHELVDADEQRARFEADLEDRAARRRVAPDIDERFLAALEAGLPDCSGVALGFDRLLMLAIGVDTLDAVQSFSFDRR